ncbi:MAG: pyrroloquinoline quinone-dependent dehydrogenase [Marinicaulis sp.]|nr:pyrroloquinoline quinone-dependent dehydrogenase [Marinicaulis sp.]
MLFNILRYILIVFIVFVAVSVFGGSLFWRMIGVGDNLEINGAAPIVRETPPGAGQGWSHYGGDAGGKRFSSADAITAENVNELEIAWSFQTGALKNREEMAFRTSFQATPIMVEDALIFCTQFNEVIAIDPGTGEKKWGYDPNVETDRRPANGYTCRGVSYWRDASAPADANCAARIFTGTVDARLIALDARTGERCSDFGIDGEVMIEPTLALRWPGEFQITSAPTLIGDVVVTGTAIGDNLRTEAPLGVVHAYDVRTGAPKWKFNPVPRDIADPARASWQGDSADIAGHANVWSTISADVERSLVFLPTSSPSPDYYGGNRAGDNKYANSVVALDSETGDVEWSYQIVHHDVWDYDLPAQPGLYQVWRDGKAHDVVAQTTKQGLVFVLDRDTGKPFLPIEERWVPQNGVDGEVLSPTQPFPVATPPIVPDTIDSGKAFGITIWDKMACARKFRVLRGDGLYTPPTTEGSLSLPGTLGGSNWGSGAFDPQRNLFIINMSNLGQAFRLHPGAPDRAAAGPLDHDAEFAPMEGAPFAMSRRFILSPVGLPCTPPPWGVLAAVDLATGEIVWRKPLGTTRDLAPGGLALPLGTPNTGGPIITAGGIIFIGAAMDNFLRAFNVSNGEELWKGRLPAGGQATPMTYEWKGRQYVVIAAGGHGRAGTQIGDHVVAFALPE